MLRPNFSLMFSAKLSAPLFSFFIVFFFSKTLC
nr:MAG TPA: hypothetical protein [Crassvirales sp.]